MRIRMWIWSGSISPIRRDLNWKVVWRTLFRYALPTIENGYGFDYNMCYSEEARAKGVVVGWEPKEREETIYHYPSYGGDLDGERCWPRVLPCRE